MTFTSKGNGSGWIMCFVVSKSPRERGEGDTVGTVGTVGEWDVSLEKRCCLK